jgi:hypothetical protein
MEDIFNQLMEKMIGRIDGPMSFRLYLQPVMAIFLAFRDGRADAKAGRLPYFLSLFTEPEKRGQRIREGGKAISRVFFLAVALDLSYQFLEMPQLRLGGAVLVAIVLAILPYVILRGLVNRVLTGAKQRKQQ